MRPEDQQASSPARAPVYDADQMAADWYSAAVDIDDRTYYHFLDLANPGLAGFRVVEHETTADAFSAISDALPTAKPGQDPHDAVTAAIAHPLWTDPEASARILQPLSEAWLAEELVTRLLAVEPNDPHPVRLVLGAAALWSRTPWPLLPLPDGRRLAEVATLQQTVPLSLSYDRTRAPVSTASHEILFIIDPATDAPVLEPGSEWDALTSDGPFRAGDPVTRRTLADALQQRDYQQLLFLGHCSSPEHADAPFTAGIVLSDRDSDPDMSWVKPRQIGGSTRSPLTAKDLMIGRIGEGRRNGHELWPMPSRIGLISCESGADPEHLDAFGLVAAMVNNGAEYVIATRWSLPTDQYCEGATSRLALAVTRANYGDDPVRQLAAWQAAQLRAWLVAPAALATHPLIWASAVAFHAP